MLDIINVPDPILRKKSKAIEKIDSMVIEFTNQLIDTLLKKSDPPGVGLSGIQVGKPWRIFITRLPKEKGLKLNKWSDNNQEIRVFINPVINKVASKMTIGGKKNKPMLEGCLSIPTLYGPVKRPEWVRVSYKTLKVNNNIVDSDISEEITKKFKGFAGRVVQHEFDHLEGVLFTDYTLKDSQPLYFDQGDELVEVQNPKDIIKW